MTANQTHDRTPAWVWQRLREEALELGSREPVLSSFYHACIVNHDSLGSALGYHLASKMDCDDVPAMLIQQVFEQAFADDPTLIAAVAADICAYYDRDPACDRYSMPLLYFKGFQAVQAYRVAHWLWRRQRHSLALFMQHRIANLFDVDIHPAAQLGQGIMVDHATGLVIGETAVVADNVSMLHSVTLGGSGCGGDRHPKIDPWVLISTGAKVLGNVRVGEGAKIGAGSVVLQDVAPHTTVVGVPAVPVGRARPRPAGEMDQRLG